MSCSRSEHSHGLNFHASLHEARGKPGFLRQSRTLEPKSWPDTTPVHPNQDVGSPKSCNSWALNRIISGPIIKPPPPSPPPVNMASTSMSRSGQMWPERMEQAGASWPYHVPPSEGVNPTVLTGSCSGGTETCA